MSNQYFDNRILRDPYNLLSREEDCNPPGRSCGSEYKYTSSEGLALDKLFWNLQGEPQSLWDSTEETLADDWLDWV